jgi:hypothetical protein
MLSFKEGFPELIFKEFNGGLFLKHFCDVHYLEQSVHPSKFELYPHFWKGRTPVDARQSVSDVLKFSVLSRSHQLAFLFSSTDVER